MVNQINVPVELLAVLLIVFVLMIWLFLKWITRLILLWRYKPENDKGKRIGGSSGTVIQSTQISPKFSGSERRSIFQTTVTREDRKDSNRIRELLKRRK